MIEQLRRYLEAVTLQLGHEGTVRAAFLSGDGRLLELDDNGLLVSGPSGGPGSGGVTPPLQRAKADKADNTGLSSPPRRAKEPPAEQGSLF